MLNYTMAYVFHVFHLLLVHLRCAYCQLVNQVSTKWKIMLLFNSRFSFYLTPLFFFLFLSALFHSPSHASYFSLLHFLSFASRTNISLTISSSFSSLLFLFYLPFSYSILFTIFFTFCTFYFIFFSFSHLFFIPLLRTTFCLHCSWVIKCT